MARYRYIVCRHRDSGLEIKNLKDAKDLARNLAVECPYLFEVWRVTNDEEQYLLYTAWDGRLRRV